MKEESNTVLTNKITLQGVTGNSVVTLHYFLLRYAPLESLESLYFVTLASSLLEFFVFSPTQGE